MAHASDPQPRAIVNFIDVINRGGPALGAAAPRPPVNRLY
jgi:hypothetical protein